MKKTDFENGSVLRNIVETALPMFVAQLIALLYNIVDRVYIGRIPETGTLALGAVGMCFPIIILVTGFTNMYAFGGSPLFSIRMGQKDKKGAAEVLNTSFRLEVITGILLILLCEAPSPAILRLFGATEEQLTYAIPYIRIYLLGTVFSMVGTGMNAFINAHGYARIGMITVLAGAAANIVLDPVFIFALGMGVQGAAVATVISQGISASLVMWFLLGKRNEYRLVKTFKVSERSCLPHAGEIISLGTAPFVMQCTNCAVSIASNNVLAHTGGVLYVSVMTIITSLRQIMDTPVFAITNGTVPVISYNYGARRPKKIREAIKLMTVIGVIYTLLMWLFIELEPKLLIGIFCEDPELQTCALRPVHLYFYGFVFQALQYSGQTVFKSLNKKKQAIFFSIFRKLILVVPLTLAMPYLFGMGAEGVFIAEPISNLVGGAACFITMLVTILPELKHMETEEKTEVSV